MLYGYPCPFIRRTLSRAFKQSLRLAAQQLTNYVVSRSNNNTYCLHKFSSKTFESLPRQAIVAMEQWSCSHLALCNPCSQIEPG